MSQNQDTTSGVDIKREKRLAQKKAYRDANKEKIHAANKVYREVNRKVHLARKKTYREANKGRLRLGNRTYLYVEIGQTYNTRIVIAGPRKGRSGHPEWLTRCECGYEAWFRDAAIRAPPRNAEDASGTKTLMLRLTVIRFPIMRRRQCAGTGSNSKRNPAREGSSYG